jgi:LAO/AO transport system kinase
VVATSAVSGQGLDDLIAAIGRHRHVAFDTEAGRERRLAIAQFRLRKTAENLLLERFAGVLAKAGAPLAAKLMRRESDPYSLASELMDSALPKERAHERDARSKIS